MKPKPKANPVSLFQANFEQILNPKHELCLLANAIDWQHFDQDFASCYSPNKGRPAKNIRLMVGLHYLKHAFNESDESVVARWVENPYWQYFCGYKYFSHECPIDPSSMTRWRDRVGADHMQELLSETLKTALRSGEVKRSEFSRVNIDTTVQEKAIAFPTDARLYCKMSLRLANLAKRRRIVLRQSYVRVAPLLLAKQGRYAHAKQYKRARKKTRHLKTILGRLVRDIERKAVEIDEQLETFLCRAKLLLAQKKKSKNKLYSIDAPEVSCISKGKAHKRYEFGCKVSVSATSKNNWVVGVDALSGNPYDGHTLNAAATQIERLTGGELREIFVDRGYRGHNYEGSADVYIAGKRAKNKSPALRKRRRRRSAIEPKIGHMKYDCRMGRNFLKGVNGDRINAILAGAGVNLRKLLRAFSFVFIYLSCDQWVFGHRIFDKSVRNRNIAA